MSSIERPGKTLTEQALGGLKRDIACHLWKEGERINIEGLKKRYSMGGTPIREALHHLVAVGVVTALPLKGFVVVPMASRECLELYETRCGLGRTVLNSLLGSQVDDWEDVLVAAAHRLKKQCAAQHVQVDQTEWLCNFKTYQRHIMKAVQSSWINHLHQMVEVHVQRHEYYFLSNANDPLNVIKSDYQYAFMLSSALLDKDASQALAISADYWRQRGQRIAEALAKR